MKVYSFTGKSGTGKSYQAIRVAKEKGIPALIDDGLLIYRNKIVAGNSAKKCESKAKAMRTALFNYEDQRGDVQKKIKSLKIKKLLVLGTSDRMVDIITDTLDLPRAMERLYIEDFTSAGEREIAAERRNNHGEHVIPAPVGDLKRDFAGYFMNPQRLLKNWTLASDETDKYEKTVVMPQYAYSGNYTISENVIGDIIRIVAKKNRRNIRVTNFYNNGKTGNLVIELDLKVRKTVDCMRSCIILQRDIKRSIEQMTSFQVKCVNVNIRELVLDREIIRSHSKK
jgi:hypothetical protein